MLTAIENIFDKLRDIINGVLDADMLFIIIVGINLLLGLILLFSALGAHKKTKRKILRDGARRESEAEITAALLPRGASVLVPLAILLFAIFVILLEYIDITPYFGLLVFELFNILSRLIYKGKTKKVKMLFTLYLEADKAPYVKPKKAQEAKVQPQPQQPQQQPQQEEQPQVAQQAYDAWVQPQQEEPQEAQDRVFDSAAPMTRPTVIFESHTTTTTTKKTQEPILQEAANTEKQVKPEFVISTASVQEEAKHEPQAKVEEQPRPTVQERPPVQEKPKAAAQEDDGHYQPFEPKRSVTQPNYSVERAPTYQVPRPPENPPQVDLPKQEPKPVVAETSKELPKNLDEYTIDDILVCINQIKKEGATKQSMSELIYIIQKEREKPENKTPEKRQKLSEALSDLLKTMNKSK